MSESPLDTGVAPLVTLVKSGAVSPVEIIDQCLARIHRLDPKINAFITLTEDQARGQALGLQERLARGESLGALAGVPVALKDNFDVAHVRTTAGSQFLANNTVEHDSEAAAALRRADAILVGKLNMHEWAVGGTTQNPFFGPCHNPWDLARIPGGSSGGSGAAVAARMVPVAMGSDTGGSIRIPAALNGVSGIRPTAGRVSRRGVLPMSWTFDAAGPLAPSVEDLAWVLREIAGFDSGDSGSVRRPTPDYVAALTRGRTVSGLRIGLLGGRFRELASADVRFAVDRACDVFVDLGASVEGVDLHNDDDLGEQMRTMMMAEAAAFHRQRMEEQPDGFGTDVLARLRGGTTITGIQYAEAREAQRVWIRNFEQVFGERDVLLAPTCPVVAPSITESESVETTRLVGALTYGFSLVGVPVLSIPCGFSSEGLPIGLQVIGPWWQEELLLSLGHAYQKATDWHTSVPPIARLNEGD